MTVVHLLAAGAVYRHLISGGWLTTNYRLNDPNVVNLGLALFEPMAMASVLAYWIWRRSWVFRMMWTLGLVQLLIGVGFLVFILLFMFFWHPRMM